MKIIFTFDVEDFINPLSIVALNRLLELLQKYDLPAIFFITGHMCEKLRNQPEILRLFEKHEIGYHSTSHSTHPNIIEYTDLDNYEMAYNVSMEREQSSINPLTGEIEGPGGFLLLQDLFPNKDIKAFRAPGFSWSPPHLEALRDMGFKFDFSTSISHVPTTYKNITFYPFPAGGFKFTSLAFWASLIVYRYAVLISHPQSFLKRQSDNEWDSIYYHGNPTRLWSVEDTSWRSWEQTVDSWRHFEKFLHTVNSFCKQGVLQVTPPLQEGRKVVQFTQADVLRIYQRSITWTERFFNYRPHFLLRHFFRYFDLKSDFATI
jgi:peptidoglycan/xylan/chitin deacetylase (PgdA/CDA1 family)